MSLAVRPMLSGIARFFLPQLTLRDPALEALKAQRAEASRLHRQTRNIDAAIRCYRHEALRGQGG